MSLCLFFFSLLCSAFERFGRSLCAGDVLSYLWSVFLLVPSFCLSRQLIGSGESQEFWEAVFSDLQRENVLSSLLCNRVHLAPCGAVKLLHLLL